MATTIKLIREDFDSLVFDSNELSKQFRSPSDCPIARALKRLYPNNKYIIGIFSVTINGKYIETEYIGMMEIERIIETLNTEQSATLDLGVYIEAYLIL